MARLSSAEVALAAVYRDEGTAELLRALAEARVEAADREFAALDLQRQLRQREAEVAALRRELAAARAEAAAWAEAAAAPGPLGAARAVTV